MNIFAFTRFFQCLTTGRCYQIFTSNRFKNHLHLWITHRLCCFQTEIKQWHCISWGHLKQKYLSCWVIT